MGQAFIDHRIIFSVSPYPISRDIMEINEGIRLGRLTDNIELDTRVHGVINLYADSKGFHAEVSLPFEVRKKELNATILKMG